MPGKGDMSPSSRALIEDLEFMLTTGESWDGALRRLARPDMSVRRALDRYGRMDLRFRLLQDHEGFAAWKRRRRAGRYLRRLDAARGREDERRMRAGLPTREAAVALARAAREREEILASVVRERFPVLVDPNGLDAETGSAPRTICDAVGCGLVRVKYRRFCAGHQDRFAMYGD